MKIYGKSNNNISWSQAFFKSLESQNTLKAKNDALPTVAHKGHF